MQRKTAGILLLLGLITPLVGCEGGESGGEIEQAPPATEQTAPETTPGTTPETTEGGEGGEGS